MLLVKPPPAHDLAHLALARNDIGVRLHPHGAFDLELPGLHPLQQARPQLGIVALQKIEQHRLVIHEDELRIFLHQPQHRGKTARRLVARMHDPPEPADIEMGRADGGDLRLGLGIGEGIDFGRNGFGFRQARLQCRAITPAPVERPQRPFHEIENGVAPPVMLVEPHRHLQRRHQVIIELFHPRVPQMKADAKPHQRPLEKGKGIDQHHMAVSRHRRVFDHQFGMVAIQRLNDLAIEIGEALRIRRARPLLPLARNRHDQPLPTSRLRHHDLGGEPGVPLLLGPDRFWPKGLPAAPVRSQRRFRVDIAALHPPGKGQFDRRADLALEIGAKPKQLALALDIIVEQPKLGRERVGIGHGNGPGAGMETTQTLTPKLQRCNCHKTKRGRSMVPALLQRFWQRLAATRCGHSPSSRGRLGGGEQHAQTICR